jgi:hypothetical protein
MQGTRVSDFDGTQFRDGGGKQYSRAFRAGHVFGLAFRKARSIPEFHHADPGNERSQKQPDD